MIIAALVLGYFIIVHILEGEVVGPRVMGHVLGLHPFVAILALVAGSELVGLCQTIIVSAWAEWRAAHPDQSPRMPPTTPEPYHEPEPTAPSRSW